MTLTHKSRRGQRRLSHNSLEDSAPQHTVKEESEYLPHKISMRIKLATQHMLSDDDDDAIKLATQHMLSDDDDALTQEHSVSGYRKSAQFDNVNPSHFSEATIKSNDVCDSDINTTCTESRFLAGQSLSDVTAKADSDPGGPGPFCPLLPTQIPAS
ncbi:hypothetical protein CB1_001202003 [Camelus ferus]|nr:hypothetical protein CB1_001202003 [Camelus ferus]